MDIETISFKIISSAGDAFGDMIEALHIAKAGDKQKAIEKMEEAKEKLIFAHRAQTDMLVSEANGTTPEFSVLLIHAQDHLMNAILAETLITEMIDMIK